MEFEEEKLKTAVRYAGNAELREFERGAAEPAVFSPEEKEEMLNSIRKRINSKRSQITSVQRRISRVAAVAAVFVCCFGLTLSVYALAPDFWKQITEKFDGYIRVSFEEPGTEEISEKPVSSDEAPPHTENHIIYREPQGMEAYEKKILVQNRFTYKVEYQLNETVINYSQGFLGSTQYSISDENTVIRDITVNGCAGKLYTWTVWEINLADIIWCDSQYTYRIGGNTDPETLLKIAESVG